MKRSIYGKNLRDFGFVRCSDDVSEKLRMAFPGLQSKTRWARYTHLVWEKDKETMIQVMRSYAESGSRSRQPRAAWKSVAEITRGSGSSVELD
jgi:hypothetical protein